jgi:KUP system potassium uptake protein
MAVERRLTINFCVRESTLNEKVAPDAGAVVRQAPRGKLPILGLSALGIVFGDIGTSPLYTFKTILGATVASPDASVVLGTLSLVLWTLFIITTVKYVSFAMRVDNDGEGGILALMALLGVKKQQRPTIVAVGLFGAAMIYGGGAITPAISVLSALEGLNMVTSALQPYVFPQRLRFCSRCLPSSHRERQPSVACLVLSCWSGSPPSR